MGDRAPLLAEARAGLDGGAGGPPSSHGTAPPAEARGGIQRSAAAGGTNSAGGGGVHAASPAADPRYFQETRQHDSARPKVPQGTRCSRASVFGRGGARCAWSAALWGRLLP